MAETQVASVGYAGEFHLHDGTELYELQQVKEFDVPGPAARDQQESTHLKSADWTREYISTFFQDRDIEVVLNSRPLSDTDTLLEAALTADDVRPFKAVLPEKGAPASQIVGTGRVINYSRGRVSGEGVMEATATIRIVTVTAIAAYSAS